MRSSISWRGTAELTGGTYRVELLWTVADDDHLVAVYRAVGGGGRQDAKPTSSRPSSSSSRTAAGRSCARSRSTRLRSTCFGMVMSGADLRMLVEEQAALKRVAVTVATTAERVFDVVTEEVARLLVPTPANLVSLGPGPEQGVIVGKWSEPGVQIPGNGTVIVVARGSAIDRVARTGAPARLATDDPGVPPELHERLVELGVTSLVAAPIVVSGEIWRSRRFRHARSAARAKHRGAARPVCEPRCRRDRERDRP